MDGAVRAGTGVTARQSGHAQHSAMPHPVFRQVSGQAQVYSSHVHPVQLLHVPLQLAAQV